VTIIDIFLSEAPVLILILPVTVASVFYALRDLLMRFAFAQRRETVVLSSNIIVAIAVATTFYSMLILGHSINAVEGIYAYAIGQAVGCFNALLLLKLPWQGMRLDRLWQAMRDCWAGGRWTILTTVVYEIRSQAHNFVVAPLLGANVLAEINASRVLVTPALMFIPPVTQILMPRLAEKRKQGLESFSHIAIISVATLVVWAIIYSLCLIVIMPFIIPLALGKPYSHVGPLVLAWCFFTVLLSLRSGMTIVMQVIRAFRELFFINFLAALFTILFAFILSHTFGGSGAIYALAAAEALLCIALPIMLRSRLFAKDIVPVTK
ncbi:MAG: MATE family efflux transporter, partial [Mobilitalea sp.]